MILDFLKDPVRQYDLCDIVCVTVAVDKETQPSQFMHEHLRCPQWLHHHLLVDVVPRDVLEPVAPLLDQELAMDSLLVESGDPKCITEAAVARHYLARVVDGLGHIQNELDSVGESLLFPLQWKGKRSIRLSCPILPLDELDLLHDWLATISVGQKDGACGGET